MAKYIYDPFGNTLSKSGPLADANAYRFSSQEYHQNSGFLLYLRRAFEPNLQRFLNRDPIAEVGGVNLYAFVANNPVSLTDSLGLDYHAVAPLWGGGHNYYYYYGDTFGEDLAAAPSNVGAAFVNTVEGIGAFMHYAAGVVFGDENADAAVLYFGTQAPVEFPSLPKSCPAATISTTASATTPWTAKAPLVADLANEIEKLYPGHVVGTEVPIYDATGTKLLTDADILLQNAVIQVKSGTKTGGLLYQLEISEATTGLPSIGYAPNLSPNAIKYLSTMGALVTTDIYTFLGVIKPR